MIDNKSSFGTLDRMSGGSSKIEIHVKPDHKKTRNARIVVNKVKNVPREIDTKHPSA